MEPAAHTYLGGPIVESNIICRENRNGIYCIIYLSGGRRKEVNALNGYSYLTLEQRKKTSGTEETDAARIAEI